MTRAFVETGTVLDRILARTAADIALRKDQVSASDLKGQAAGRAKPLNLAEQLRAPGVSVIAEIKRAAPSRGAFPVEIDPSTVAREYLDGGAAAISVLTDQPFFQGSMADLSAVAAVAHVRNTPILRKDFIIDDYQLIEALAAGADAVLLIVAALAQSLLIELMAKSSALGLSTLVEVHDQEEMGRAIDAGADVIGINNRDLRTFEIDLATTERLASLAPESVILVAESGIVDREDVERLQIAGVDAVLVGESLILAEDRAAAIRRLRFDRTTS